MKFVRTALLTLLVTVSMVACSKDETATGFSIEGLWEGKIGADNDIPTGNYSLRIKKGGALERIGQDGDVSATGSWNLQENNFTGIYFYSDGTVVDVTATLNKEAYSMTGNWENNHGGEGNFNLSKK